LKALISHIVFFYIPSERVPKIDIQAASSKEKRQEAAFFPRLPSAAGCRDGSRKRPREYQFLELFHGTFEKTNGNHMPELLV